MIDKKIKLLGAKCVEIILSDIKLPDKNNLIYKTHCRNNCLCAVKLIDLGKLELL